MTRLIADIGGTNARFALIEPDGTMRDERHVLVRDYPDPVALGAHLMNAHRIFTTPILHDEFKGVRITPNVYTTLAELDRFAEAVETIARQGLPKT